MSNLGLCGSSRVGPACAVRGTKCVQPRLVRVGIHTRLAAISDGASPSRGTAFAQEQDERRWESNVREGRVKNVMVAEIAALMRDGWVLLDVRPPDEVSKVAIQGAVAVPLFTADPSNSLGSLVKKLTAFGMGGWWLGGSHMVTNLNFLAEVQAQVAMDAKVVVGCQKGLRSLAAAEQLSLAGYRHLGWVNGGFDTASPDDLPTVGGKDIRYAGIGGLSELLGWTEVQQDSSGARLGGAQEALKLVALLLALDLLLFGLEQVAFMTGAQLPL